jgi:hypothetical protein
MAREGGCEWYQSIALYIFYISADFKKNFKGSPGPLNIKKRSGTPHSIKILKSYSGTLYSAVERMA